MGDLLRVTLPSHLVAAMDAAIKDGEYLDRGDLVRCALRAFLGEQ